jgi:hypothetical protein
VFQKTTADFRPPFQDVDGRNLLHQDGAARLLPGHDAPLLARFTTVPDPKHDYFVILLPIGVAHNVAGLAEPHD